MLEPMTPGAAVEPGVIDFGPFEAGEVRSQEAEPFAIEISPIAAAGDVFDFLVTADYPGGAAFDTLSLVVDRQRYLVWDPTQDQSSGRVIARTLDSLGYSGHFRRSIYYVDLERYSTCFVSLGVFGDKHVVLRNAPEVPKLITFLDAGGHLYLEGGDVWYYDPLHNAYDFAPHFEIEPKMDGYPDLATAVGQNETCMEDLALDYVGENAYIDRLDRLSGARVIFRNGNPDYGCGVGHDRNPGHTIGVSFELGGLSAGMRGSARREVLTRIMHFFMPAAVQDIGDESPVDPAARLILALESETFSADAARVRFSLAAPAPVAFDLFDVSGRSLWRARHASPAGTQTQRIPLTRLASGTYWVRLQAGKEDRVLRLVRVR